MYKAFKKCGYNFLCQNKKDLYEHIQYSALKLSS